MKFGETMINACIQEVYEEIDFMIERSQINKLEFVGEWGRETMFKFDISATMKSDL